MKKIILAVACLLLFSVPVYADSMYVSGIVKITLRSGPGTDNRVIGMVESGQAVDVLQKGEEWCQVRLSDGKEGWVLSRLLTPDKPRILLLEETAEKNKALVRQFAELADKNKGMAEENRELANELAKLKARLGEAEHSYAKLQQDASDFITLRSKYQKSARDLDAQIKKADELEQKLRKLRSDRNLWWFLVGAGVLLAGFLLGLSAKRQRRRYVIL